MRLLWLVVLVALAGCPTKKKPAPALKDAGVAVTLAGDGGGGPTRAECEAAISNMQKLAPTLVPGDAVDLEECLKLPRTLVACLQKVTTSAEADACVDRAATDTFGSAPLPPPPPPVEPRATAEACGKMVAHYRTLLPEAERDETTEASMLAACTRELTPSEADCVLAARALPDIEACLEGG